MSCPLPYSLSSSLYPIFIPEAVMSYHEHDIRWKQRFQNFERAFLQLKAPVMEVENLSDLEKEGLVQRFEYTFELAWKTLKDYLQEQAVDVRFPREVIKESFHYGLIDDGELWMDMLAKRNMMAHTYEDAAFRQAVSDIVSSFYPAITSLYHYLRQKI
jgi:nucleotidyltransferase substrate binding protein (TIGR01987 family)